MAKTSLTYSILVFQGSLVVIIRFPVLSPKCWHPSPTGEKGVAEVGTGIPASVSQVAAMIQGEAVVSEAGAGAPFSLYPGHHDHTVHGAYISW